MTKARRTPSCICMKVQELNESTGRESYDSYVGLWPHMFRSKKVEIKANFRDLFFLKGRETDGRVMKSHANTVVRLEY